ncbi:MAG: hypothetical protein H8E66_21400 [Planctomycetes bacterium]|nr:hypothetical protein [Planctomycetota bacterium]
MIRRNWQLLEQLHISTFFAHLAACACIVTTVNAIEPATPQVRVTNVRRVFYNGEHNAFTDLVRFRDRFYLTFRSCPDGHMVFPTSSNIILESDDARSWRPAHRFSVPKRDTRDPHFLIFKDKLFAYTGTWYCGDSAPEVREFNKQLGYAVVSSDGRTWSKPIMLEGTYGHFIWRAAAHDGTAYLCGRRKREFVETPTDRRPDCEESVMLESKDGLIWQKRALFQTHYGNETAFLFEPDGSVLAVARFTLSDSQLCRSKPPYSEWKRTNLDRFIGGPLVAKWGNRYLVGGRKTVGDKGPKTSLDWLVDGKLHEFAELPSGGDNSYPGFVELSPTRGLVSWYSSHEKDDSGKTITAIYMADLEVTASKINHTNSAD